jgi:transposase
VSASAALDDSSWVGALTAIAFVLIVGEAERFGCGKQIASYLGLVPEEDSSGERRRLGHIISRATPCYVFCWWKRRR